jgi:hypothetical protein
MLKELLTAAAFSAFDSLAIAGVVVVRGIVAVFTSERWLHRCHQAEAPTEERVNASGVALQRAGATVIELESEIGQCQHNPVYPGWKEQATLELTKGEVEAVAQLLRGELRREGRRAFWMGVAQSAVFFALGTAVTIAVALLTSGGATHR